MPFEQLQELKLGELLEERKLFAEDERVAKAAGHLRETREYEVFLLREKRLSFATTRDLLDVKTPLQTRLGNVCVYSPVLEPSETTGRAAQLMYEYRLRGIPSFAEGEKVRVISAVGIVQRMSELASPKIAANEVMTPLPVTVSADDTAEKARQLMLRRSFDHLPVLKNGKLFGVVTSSHLLQHMLPEVGPGPLHSEERVRFDFDVGAVADEDIVSVGPETPLSKVIEAILGKRSSYVLVNLWEELQGIITLRDLVQLLIRRKKATAPFYIVGLPSEPFEAEAAKMKLERLGTALTRSFPFIQEIRAVVKSKQGGGPRKRHEVTVTVYTPRMMHSYVAQGYDLSETFDRLAPMLKRILASKQSKVTRTQGASIRKRSD